MMFNNLKFHSWPIKYDFRDRESLTLTALSQDVFMCEVENLNPQRQSRLDTGAAHKRLPLK